MPLYEYRKDRVIVYCTIRGCGKMLKGETEKAARLTLAHHNFLHHPGVFPRWNPSVEAIDHEPRARR